MYFFSYAHSCYFMLVALLSSPQSTSATVPSYRMVDSVVCNHPASSSEGDQKHTPALPASLLASPIGQKHEIHMALTVMHKYPSTTAPPPPPEWLCDKPHSFQHACYSELQRSMGLLQVSPITCCRYFYLDED